MTSLIDEATGLGSLSQALASRADSLYKKFANGDGSAAIQEMLSAALAAGGAAACTAVGAGVVAPICALVGEQFGQAIGSAIWGSGAPGAVPPTENRQQRYGQLYNQLLALVPDDRASGVSKYNSVYEKAAAQLSVICNLYVDGNVWGPDGTEDIDPSLVGDEPWQLGPATKVAAGGPQTMIGQFTDLPHLANPNAEFYWLKATYPLAFQAPTLPEFEDTQAGYEMRRHLWNFYSWPTKTETGTEYETGLGKMFLARSVARVLTVANVTNELRFLEIIRKMAETTKARYLPLCNGEDSCVKGVLGEAWTGAYLVCLAARGIGTNAPLLAEATENTLDHYVAVSDVFKANDLITTGWKPKKTKTVLTVSETKAAKEGAAREKEKQRKKAESGVSAGDVLLGVSALVVVAVGGLTLERKRRGLKAVPSTWKPKGWLR